MKEIEVPGALEIYDHHDDGSWTLVLDGELDIATAPALEAKVDELLAAKPAEIVLDLRALRFIDSTGLSAMLAAKASCEVAGCRFFATRAHGAVQRLFEVVGAADQLPLMDSTSA